MKTNNKRLKLKRQKIFSQFYLEKRRLNSRYIEFQIGTFVMVFPSTYILLLAPQLEELQGLESLLQQVALDVEIVDTADQALARVLQNPPCLIILQEHLRSESTIHQLRTIADADRMTLVIVTEIDSPSWFHQDQRPDVDGFLVKPLSSDVLFSLIHSASARQYCQRS
ncbi:MAG: hypothetical protein KME10_23050 [Plectolyngbya sp. WJT66-NPBG17]|nr:hypothetical protein [Plectolyngbya sp. WJT66-NPBG17]MBW4528000.1 hypothetical protein [Phormidium tanganyikae FI6-MK23]